MVRCEVHQPRIYKDAVVKKFGIKSSWMSLKNVLLGNLQQEVPVPHDPDLESLIKPEELVSGLYALVLGRTPDEKGLGDMVALLNQGLPYRELVEILLTSGEYQERMRKELKGENPGAIEDKQFIEIAYKTLFRRTPDPGGLVTSLEQLANGCRRAEFLQNIANSLEFKNELKKGVFGGDGFYVMWHRQHHELTAADREAIQGRIDQLEQKPLISIVMPTYNTEERWLRAAIESVLKQSYSHWELCIADDCSSDPRVRRILETFLDQDSRIKVHFREKNGHIAAASNSALALASGEYIALLDHDDELSEHALYMVAEEINRFPEADLIYSDEDKINEKGYRCDPYFKSDWNPELFFGHNMISHLGVYRHSLVKDLGGFRTGYEGSQDYDLALRVIERTSPANIRHIPHVLYHWRIIPGSVALNHAEKSYAHEAARRAMRDHFQRRGIEAEVTQTPGEYFLHRIIYPLPTPQPKVTLIIPTRDREGLLRLCVNSLLSDTAYDNFEILIVDNESADPVTLEYFDHIAKNPRVRVIPYAKHFNFSAINNLGATQTSGDLVGFLNNDLAVLGKDWLSQMVRHALRPEVGVVGAKLYYPNESIQHAGIVLGVQGMAGHVHRELARHHHGYFSRAQLTQCFSAVTGACMIMRRDVFNEVGGFDELLPVAFNDIDLCLKIGELGYRVVWNPYAELFHFESASRGTDTGKKQIRLFHEMELMIRRWGEKLVNDPYYNPNLTLELDNFSLSVKPRAMKPWYPGEPVKSLWELFPNLMSTKPSDTSYESFINGNLQFDHRGDLVDTGVAAP